jgi:hypothetical protein
MNSEYGVCRLSVMAVRSEASDKAEQVTQLLFGDHYEVTLHSKDKKWLKINIAYDQYEGWIDVKQHHAISKEYYDYLGRAEFKISTDITSSMLYMKSPLTILMGSMIPISSSELFKMEEQFAFNGETKNVGQRREYEYLKNVAMNYINAPYVWGGKNPFGIDCSGFTQMVFKISGYKLFRDAHQQATQGREVASLNESRPGDIVFFKNTTNKIVHVGILLNEDKIIHASGRVRVDTITEKGIVHAETGVQTHTYSHVRRILID